MSSSNLVNQDLEAIITLAKFLETHHIYSIKPLDTYSKLEKFIDDHFCLLNEEYLRAIITAALEYRDKKTTIGQNEDLFGAWALIIDAIKEIIQRRRELAGTNFQQLIKYGMEGDQKKVDTYLTILNKKGFVDHLFESILHDTLDICQKNKQEEHVYMLTYFLQTIDSFKEERKQLLQNQANERQKQSKPSESSLPSVPTKSSSEASADPNPPVPPAKELSKEPIKEDSSDKPQKGSQEIDREDPTTMYAMMAAGDLLNNIIKEANGNMKFLQEQLLKHMKSGDINHLFMAALEDNLIACQEANYVNKTKLFIYIKQFIQQNQHLLEETISSLTQQNKENQLQHDINAMSSYHAPQFLESSILKRLIPVHENIVFFNALKEKIGFLENKQLNPKKKTEKKEIKRRRKQFVSKVSQHLNEKGWSVVDDFVPLDLIHRVRIESNLFKDYFEQSEIWIGKEADVGAHLRVPSIRGDHVLWLCGGHNMLNHKDQEEKVVDPTSPYDKNHAAPEGITRHVKTIGEIEPCNLKIKAAAPIRKFNALKEIITACDTIVEDLKEVNEHLQGIYERSDAMLTIYPGEGSRFANHIDNTTKDGRRLTLLVYLNPNWTEEQGGALRITERGEGKKVINDQGVETLELPAVDVYPMAARLAIFYSSEIPHEVMPTFGNRHAITFWYYDRDERKEAIRHAREAGKAANVAKYSDHQQIEAKDFIGELMGGDEVTVDGGEPTKEELASLASKVKKLSSEAVEIVSSITGAPSAQSFKDGFELLTTQDLKSMRALFRRMGLH